MVALQHAHGVHETALGGVLGRRGSRIERGDCFREIFHLVGMKLLRGGGGRHALQLLQLLFLGFARLTAARGEGVSEGWFKGPHL
jgi:hypothetical protein